MFVRSLSTAVAIFGVAGASFLPAETIAAEHHAGAIGASHGPSITFSLGHGSSSTSSSIHLRDFSRLHEPMKPFEVASPAPKPVPTFPSFANPLHRHHMAMIWF